MTKQILAELDKLAKACRNTRDVTGDTLDIYLEDLGDLPEQEVIQAIQECRRTETFFPSISEIRNRVVAIIGASVLVDAEVAWGEVMAQIRRVGVAGRRTYFHNGEQHVIERQFSTPMIERAVEAVGWRDICLTETDQLGTLRAQFRDALRVIQRREVDRIVSGRHAGDWAALSSGEPSNLRVLPNRSVG